MSHKRNNSETKPKKWDKRATSPIVDNGRDDEDDPGTDGFTDEEDENRDIQRPFRQILKPQRSSD